MPPSLLSPIIAGEFLYLIIDKSDIICMIIKIYLCNWLNLNHDLNESIVLLSSDNHYWTPSDQFVLHLYVSIIISESCPECRIKTLHSIQTQSIPFNIPQQDGSSIIVSIQKPLVKITSDLDKIITITGDLLFVFQAFDRILDEEKEYRRIESAFAPLTC